MSDKEEVFEPIPKFNDHGSGCSGHANEMLDNTYETKEARSRLVKCVSNYIEE